MDNFNKLSLLIKEANDIITNTKFSDMINNLSDTISDLELENNTLKKEINIKKDEIKQLNQKYENDIKIKTDEIKNKTEELASLTKVSYVQSLNKQLNEKLNYIKILESQLEKFKTNNLSHPSSPKLSIQIPQPEETKPDNNNNKTDTDKQDKNEEKTKSKKKKLDISDKKIEDQEVKVEPKEELPKKKKSKEPIVEASQVTEHIFDPDNFEDQNGYELMLYKKKYYLRDLETNELYDIINNKPNNIVGLINSSGKVKFN